MLYSFTAQIRNLELKSGQEIGLSRTANIVLHGILYALSDMLEIWISSKNTHNDNKKIINNVNITLSSWGKSFWYL